MKTQMAVKGLQARFTAAFELLRLVFQDEDVPFGKLAHLQAFPARLDSSNTVAEATASILSDLIVSENPPPTRMELLNLLCLAVGDLDVSDAGDALRPSVLRVLIFVNGVFLSLQQAPAGQAPPSSTKAPAVAGPAEPSELAEVISWGDVDTDLYVLENFGLPAGVSPNDTEGVPMGMPFAAAFEDEYITESFGDVPAISDVQNRENQTRQHGKALAAFADVPPQTGTSLVTETPPLFGKVQLDEKPVANNGDLRAASAPKRTPVGRWSSLSTVSTRAWMACAAAVGFSLGLLVPRYTAPCVATPSQGEVQPSPAALPVAKQAEPGSAPAALFPSATPIASAPVRWSRTGLQRNAALRTSFPLESR